MEIAGHDFDSLDRCRTCPRTWCQIMHTTEDQIGEDGIAHQGALNSREYQTIEARRDSDRTRLWNLIVGVSTGGAVAPVLDPEYSMFDDSRMEDVA